MASDDSPSPLGRLHDIEQAAHAHAIQLQTYQGQLAEIGNALRELGTPGKAFRIVGSVMVEADSAKLREELEERSRALEARVVALRKQEERLRAQMRELQERSLSGEGGQDGNI